MLDLENRVFEFEMIKEKIDELYSYVEDVLAFKYKPYGKKPDDDTPYIEKLFWSMDRIYESAVEHMRILNKQLFDAQDYQEEHHLYDVLDDVLDWKLPELIYVGETIFLS